MAEPKTYFKTQSEELCMEVRTSLESFSREACEQVWDLIQLTTIDNGLLVLVVTKKVTGQPGAKAVKVVGLANNSTNFVLLKFQASPETCFEGTLSLRVDGALEYGSRLKEALIDVAGIGWYVVNRPETKQLPRPSLPPLPLATVGASLVSAAKESAASTNGHNPSVKGLVKNFEASQAVFRIVAAKSVKGVINASDLSLLVMSHIAGKPVESGRGSGPIAAAWRKLDYIDIVPDEDGPKRYFLTEKARKKFSLVFEEYKGPILADQTYVRRLTNRIGKRAKSASADKLLRRFAKATANCQKLNKIRDSIADLEAKAQKIEKQLAKLKKLAQNQALLDSEALINQFRELKLK